MLTFTPYKVLNAPLYDLGGQVLEGAWSITAEDGYSGIIGVNPVPPQQGQLFGAGHLPNLDFIVTNPLDAPTYRIGSAFLSEDSVATILGDLIAPTIGNIGATSDNSVAGLAGELPSIGVVVDNSEGSTTTWQGGNDLRGDLVATADDCVTGWFGFCPYVGEWEQSSDDCVTAWEGSNDVRGVLSAVATSTISMSAGILPQGAISSVSDSEATFEARISLYGTLAGGEDSTSLFQGSIATKGTLQVVSDDSVGEFEGVYPTKGSLNAVGQDSGGSFGAWFIPKAFIEATTEDSTANFQGGADQVAVVEGLSESTALFLASIPPAGNWEEVAEDSTASIISHYADNVGTLGIQTEDSTTEWEATYDHGIDRNLRTSEVCGVVQQGTTMQITRHHYSQDAARGDTPVELYVDVGDSIESNVCILGAYTDLIDAGYCVWEDDSLALSSSYRVQAQWGVWKTWEVCSWEQYANSVNSSALVDTQDGRVVGIRYCAWVQDAGMSRHDYTTTEYQPHQDTFKPLLYRCGQGDIGTTYNMPVQELIAVHYPSIQVGVIRPAICHTVRQGEGTTPTTCAKAEDARDAPFGKSKWVDAPIEPVDPNPPSGESIVVPRLGVYEVNNVISVTLEDGTPIAMDSITLEMTSSAFSWMFSGTLLDRTQKDLLKPNDDGTAVLLDVTVNSTLWKIVVEKTPTRRVFANTGISVTGRGLTALLGSPYYPKKSAFVDAQMTNQQLAELMLPVDWTVDWQMPTWGVPAGAYSYQNKTPIEALRDIVDSCGGMVVPSLATKTVKVIPRYPVLPWNYQSTVADVVIPDSVIVELTEEPVARNEINGVYVHGFEVGGKLGFVRRTGTAGDKLTTTESNALMVDDTALRSLGERILAGEYPQPKVRTFTTLVDPQIIDLVSLGAFLDLRVHPDDTGVADGVVTPIDTIYGIVNGVRVAVARDEVWQTLTIGEAGNNVYEEFKSLLPKDPVLVGTVLLSVGGVTTITLYDGGSLKVRGTASVGSKVYVRGGVIQGAAPNLVLSTIVIG